MVKDTTRGMEETKLFTASKGTPREHNCDFNSALRLSMARQEKIEREKSQIFSPS